MKPFDLKAALAGAKVVTRDGRDVTQLTYLKGLDAGEYCICGVVELGGKLQIDTWINDGCAYSSKRPDDSDLFMAPTERKEWVVRVAYPEPISATILPANSLQKANEIASKYSNATIHEITIHE